MLTFSENLIFPRNVTLKHKPLQSSCDGL